MKCSVCGFEFSEQLAVAVCSTCPIVKKCPLIRCPNCSYEWPRQNSPDRLYQSLLELPLGHSTHIISICPLEPDLLKKVIALGFLPGIKVSIINKSPVVLCQIGYSQIAIDEEIAKNILVSR